MVLYDHIDSIIELLSKLSPIAVVWVSIFIAQRDKRSEAAKAKEAKVLEEKEKLAVAKEAAEEERRRIADERLNSQLGEISDFMKSTNETLDVIKDDKAIIKKDLNKLARLSDTTFNHINSMSSVITKVAQCIQCETPEKAQQLNAVIERHEENRVKLSSDMHDIIVY